MSRNSLACSDGSMHAQLKPSGESGIEHEPMFRHRASAHANGSVVIHSVVRTTFHKPACPLREAKFVVADRNES